MSASETDALVAGVLLLHATRRNNRPCPLVDWVKAQAGREDTDQVRAELVVHDGWQADRPILTLDGFRVALAREDAGRDAVQVFWARELLDQPFGVLVGHVERLILGERTASGEVIKPAFGGLICAEAWGLLAQWWAMNHRNAKAWFSRSDVLAMVPSSIDLTELPHGTRADLAGIPLRGLRND